MQHTGKAERGCFYNSFGLNYNANRTDRGYRFIPYLRHSKIPRVSDMHALLGLVLLVDILRALFRRLRLLDLFVRHVPIIQMTCAGLVILLDHVPFRRHDTVTYTEVGSKA